MSCFAKIVLASSDPEKGVLVRVQGVPCYGGFSIKIYGDRSHLSCSRGSTVLTRVH